MALTSPDPEWKKGSAELLVLSLLEDQPRHGYDISKLIQIRSGGALRFHVTSLYPLLHRLEKQGWIAGRWVEKAEQRRRRYYNLTARGRHELRPAQENWNDFVTVIGGVALIDHGCMEKSGSRTPRAVAHEGDCRIGSSRGTRT